MGTASALKNMYAMWESQRVDGKIMHGSPEDLYGAFGHFCDDCEIAQRARLAQFWLIYHKEQGYSDSEIKEFFAPTSRSSLAGMPVRFAHGGAEQPKLRRRKRERRRRPSDQR